ncbi:MAG: FtsX-like permease family protein [Saprospiraceae bacterium]
MNLLRLSWKNLTFKPLSMWLSIILFALGVGLISLLLLLEHQLQRNFEKNLAGIDLVIGAKGSPLQLILSSMYHIDNPTGNVSIDEVRPFLNPAHPLIQTAVPLSLGDSYKGFRIVGTTPAILEVYGVALDKGALWQHDLEVVAGAAVARELGLTMGSSFHSSHGLVEDENLAHDHADFKVVGILQPSGTVLDQLLLTANQSYWMVHEHVETPTTPVPAAPDHDDHDHAEADHDHDHDHDHEEHHHDATSPASSTPLWQMEGTKDITVVLVKFKGRNFQALNMQRSINENTDMQAATPAIEINRLYSLMDTGEKALRILAVVIIIVSGLSIFIALLGSLKERRYELALMRVMGARPRRLFALIMLEGLLLAVAGCALGLLLSHGSMQLLGSAMKDAYRYDFTGYLFLDSEWWIVIGSLLIGLLAALWPAISASSTDISETLLRNE